jgi:hypothetical protein
MKILIYTIPERGREEEESHGETPFPIGVRGYEKA